MKSSRRARFYSPRTPTTTINKNNLNSPSTQSKSVIIPIESPIPITKSPKPLPYDESTAAVKIQTAYRSHVIRTLIKKISAVKNEADRLESLIQRQETVDAIRSDEKEKMKMNEDLMKLLLKLDSVPGVYEQVREVRRKVSRRIVGLQEIMDGLTDERASGSDELRMVRCWEEMVAEAEERMWEEVHGGGRGRGGGGESEMEMERYCVEKLGFRCFERFLRGV